MDRRQAFLHEARSRIEACQNRTDVLQWVCEELQDRFPGFDWVGFYIASEADRHLLLGPFAGTPTEHTRIPYGRGICGQVAVSGQTHIAPDVAAEDNYIACSTAVRSEIVVPILAGGTFVAQLDIDSHVPDAFSREDRLFLEKLCVDLGRLFAKVSSEFPSGNEPDQ